MDGRRAAQRLRPPDYPFALFQIKTARVSAEVHQAETRKYMYAGWPWNISRGSHSRSELNIISNRKLAVASICCNFLRNRLKHKKKIKWTPKMMNMARSNKSDIIRLFSKIRFQ